jgi:hypothetical protein
MRRTSCKIDHGRVFKKIFESKQEGRRMGGLDLNG